MVKVMIEISKCAMKMIESKFFMVKRKKGYLTCTMRTMERKDFMVKRKRGFLIVP